MATKPFVVNYQGWLAAQIVCNERGKHFGCIMGYALVCGSKWDGWVIASDTVMEKVCGNLDDPDIAIRTVAERWSKSRQPYGGGPPVDSPGKERFRNYFA